MSVILNDIPLGERRFEMGMILRQTWFINGTLYNSEVWGSFSDCDIEVLNVLDRKILRLKWSIWNVVPGNWGSKDIPCHCSKETCVSKKHSWKPWLWGCQESVSRSEEKSFERWSGYKSARRLRNNLNLNDDDMLRISWQRFIRKTR